MSFKVDVVCKNEKTDIATVKTPGPLDEALLNSTASLLGTDGRRYPIGRVRNGETMRCKLCRGDLYFRLSDGRLIDAIPGTFKVTG